MAVEMQIFDAAGTPLRTGVNLVEASAGTGKTYAIAMLVLRAIVEQEIDIDKILIVTFTKAATEELRSRIRARLVEARDLLKGDVGAFDPTLAAWFAGVNDKTRCLRRLQLALCDIDRAGIYTIHGFCQRMLIDQALESGQLFDVELLADIGPVRSEVAEDFWRRRVYGMDLLPCSIVMQEFANPQKLLQSVDGVNKGTGRIEPVTESLEIAIASLDGAFEVMSVWWQENGKQLIDQLEQILAAKGFKKRLTESFEVWQRSLETFFAGSLKSIPADLHLLQRDELIKELNGNKYRGEAKKKAVLEGLTMPGRKIAALLGAIDSLVLSLRVQLAAELQGEVEKRLNQHGFMSFDDLISRFSTALQGDRGKELKRIIRQRFRIALIDEFQDTDSDQWFIFSELFAKTDHYLYLIGDPKQAIYKFRGADIYSYFSARKFVDHHLTLDKNYRSHPYLVDEVNRLFQSRSNPFFFDQDLIDYYPVQSAKKNEKIDLSPVSDPLAGMVYCLLPPDEKEHTERWSSGKAAKEIRNFTAAEISRLLDLDELKLQPRDIAVLVRSNRQAADYLHEFNKTGIPAIISGRESVFMSEECRELYVLLQAVAQPGDLSILKTAMTLRWFGLKGYDLVELWQDENRFGQWHERFIGYNSIWQKKSFLVMMSRLIIAEEVYITLASQQGTERSVTNIQHLLELVQEMESSEHFHIGQTLLWLRRMMETEFKGESGELRLESDDEAVQIITMHGAKGLEYPVVFCPYLWYRTNRLQQEKHCIASHDKEGNLIVDLGSDEFDNRREDAMREEMAEDLRLLYVAITRAVSRCYVMWCDVKGHGIVGDSFDSPLGYLLFPAGKCSASEQQDKLQELSRSKSAQIITIDIGGAVPPFDWHKGTDKLQPLYPSGRDLHTDWQMSSYSALTSLTEYEDELLPGQKEQKGVTPIPVIGLPAGPNFGNVVHDMLESIPFAELAAQGDHKTILSAKCRKYGVEVEAEPLIQLLQNVVTCKLLDFRGSGSFSLSSLQEDSCLKEMEFYFHMSRVETEMINHVLASEATVCPLSHKVMQGYLTGLIDLVCAHDTRYYILDYKTNYLGDSMEDYEPDKLSLAMRSHNYGLQFWIYTLVLHRHLKNVLTDYNYQEHFGGVFYLFVRGMKQGEVGNGVFSTVPDIELLEELDRILGGTDGE